jgi:hypothetical protein
MEMDRLCVNGATFCASLGRCAPSCPEEPFVQGKPENKCSQDAQRMCLAMPNSLEAAACARSLEIPLQEGAPTQEQLGEMLLFPEASLRGLVAGRKCLPGPF